MKDKQKIIATNNNLTTLQKKHKKNPNVKQMMQVAGCMQKKKQDSKSRKIQINPCVQERRFRIGRDEGPTKQCTVAFFNERQEIKERVSGLESRNQKFHVLNLV